MFLNLKESMIKVAIWLLTLESHLQNGNLIFWVSSPLSLFVISISP